jgi:hypothetical protein
MMGAKSKGNYPTGGWCAKRKNCANDGKCDKCIRYSEYREKK